MVENIKYQDKLLSIIIRADFQRKGIEFFTPDSLSQQLAYMHHPKGHKIDPHVHNIVVREIQFTQEVLYIKSGKVRIDFYEDDHSYIKSTIVNTGDVILLAHGGHGCEMLEESEIIEIKQGPYIGEKDKTRFEGVDNTKIKFED